MKGQSVNIDYTMGIAVFLFSILMGVIALTSMPVGPQKPVELRQKAMLLQSDLEAEAGITGRKAPLYVSSPHLVKNVPLDRDYFFVNAHPWTGAMDVPAEIDIQDNRIVTVVDAENATHHLAYFRGSNSNLSYSSDISTGSWMNSTNISVKPGAPGLTSMQLNGKEFLNEDADLNGNDYTVEEAELHASTLNGDLKVYSGSTEMILENASTVTFDLKNFTTLYWHEDGSTTNTVGTGAMKSGDTKAFTLATFQGAEYGVTFLGNMTATVSKPTTDTIRAEIDAERLRIRLHDGDYTAGRRRAGFSAREDMFFGAEKVIRGVSSSELEEIDNWSRSRFESTFQLGDTGYNISLGNLDRGERLPYQDVVVYRSAGTLLGRYGNFSLVESRVAIW